MGCISHKSKLKINNFLTEDIVIKKNKENQNNIEQIIDQDEEDLSSNQIINYDSIKKKSFKKNNKEINVENNINREESNYANHRNFPTNFETNVVFEQKMNNKQLTINENEELKTYLTNHYLFKDKSLKIIEALLKKIEVITFEPNTIIFNEGDIGDFFYIIKEGSVESYSNNLSNKKILNKGENFGELALLERKKRTETIKTINNVILYQLDGKIVREIVKNINKNELKERLEFISLVPIFDSMDNIKLNFLASSMYKCTFDTKENIFIKGDLADSIYIIKSGEVNCELDKKVIRVIKSKEIFGEYSILFNLPRSLSCNAKNKVTCYKITDSLLIEAFGNNYKNIILKSILKESFKMSNFLSILANDNFIDYIFNESIIKLYQNGEYILEKENFDNNQLKIYTIITGNIVSKENDTITILGKRNQLYGEEFIHSSYKLKFDLIAQEEVRLIEINWNSILKFLDKNNSNNKENLNNSFESNKNKKYEIKRTKTLSFFSLLQYLKKNEFFRNNSNNKLMIICSLMTKEKYKPNEYIFKEGEIGDKFYLIKKGKLSVLKDNKIIREMEEGNCFGELALLNNEPRSATIKTETKCTLYILTKQNFDESIDKKMLDYLKIKISLQDNFNMKLSDFYFCKKLGEGKFGNVSLIHNNKNFYAIKAVSKKAGEKQKILIKYFIEEKKVLLKIDHPFIMKLVRTFKNEDNIFYLTEFINGQVLGKYLEKKSENSFLNKKETQFYIAFLFIILNYLNSKNIIHRDLKPDNIMIDNKGYLKLIDFGTAINIKDFTSTITGTPHYISPEVLNGKGYSFSCDYWSIGIITHEIYYNYYPFGDNANDPMEVYKEILQKEIKLPSNGNAIVNSFILNLLIKNVHRRICSFDNAKKHPFFKNFPWEDLIDFHLIPPYIPNCIELKKFDDYNLKYCDYLYNEKLKRNNEDTILSSFDDEIKFDNNWDDIF